MLSKEQENALARQLQAAVPFVPDPFAAIAAEVGLSTGEVLDQLSRWREQGALREISAVLEGSALGWDSALVAGQVAEERIDAVAAVVSAHPTVTHNYVRRHDFNLWFTIAVPPEMSLEHTLRVLAEESGVSGFHALRRTETFKIGVSFDLESAQNQTEAVALREAGRIAVSPRERRLFRALQAPLPIDPRPFAKLAGDHGTTEDELIAFGALHLGGAIRRYVGTFRHRHLGVRGNGMVVWSVPRGELSRCGARLAAQPEVSHCYARIAIPGFPYSLYSMIHGPDGDTVRRTVARIAGELGLTDFLVLESTRELKKCRLRYFLPELDLWWSTHAAKTAKGAA